MPESVRVIIMLLVLLGFGTGIWMVATWSIHAISSAMTSESILPERNPLR